MYDGSRAPILYFASIETSSPDFLTLKLVLSTRLVKMGGGSSDTGIATTRFDQERIDQPLATSSNLGDCTRLKANPLRSISGIVRDGWAWRLLFNSLNN